MSYTKAFGFFFLIFASILFYMTYTWFLEYSSALKSKKAIFEIESCQSFSGNVKRMLALGKVTGESSKRAVDITEYKKYLKKNDPSSAINTLETCKKGVTIPVWNYDTGMLRGRDQSRNLQSDTIRASILYEKIKLWVLIGISILILGIILVKNSK